ncbi:MAG TPA: hypothetical protein VGU01_09595 [Sphingomicrobium sp.]|nr:hypothetical protein [Sphingomicrobium sp.]
MAVGIPVAFLLFAQAVSVPSNPSTAQKTYGPAPAAVPAPAPAPKPERECTNQNNDPNGNEIVVCAIKPEGYRLPPDIVEARRLKKEGITVRPHNPHEAYLDHSCANVGPMGCRGTPTLNMLAVAATAAEISRRLAASQEVGSLFETEKSSTDYQLYQMAKKEREEKEAVAAAKAVRDKARAAAQKAAPNGTPAPSGN